MTGSFPRVLGIDPSLTGTGLAILQNDDIVKVLTVKPGLKRGHERMDWILSFVSDAVGAGPLDLVVIEGPSYGSAAGQSGHHERAGLWWIITRALHVRKLPYAVASPASRAMYATGAGNAGKQLVIDCMAQRYPHARLRDDNQADALTLAAMGVEYLGGEVPPGAPRGKLALKKVMWPELPSDEAAA